MIAARLDKSWADSLVAGVRGESDPRWPWTVTVTALSGRDMNERWSDTWRWILEVTRWATEHGCTVATTNRRVGGTSREIPTRVTVPDIDCAAAGADGDWTLRLTAARPRIRILYDEFPTTLTPALARAAVVLGDVDFDLARRAAEWFSRNDAAGFTARQVPIAGMHAKWLDRHSRLVCGLAGRSSLCLVQRPSRVRFSYLDPGWLAGGNRRRDSVSLDETHVPPGYTPDVVVITENKDTAMFCPKLAGGIVIEGEGDAASRLPRIPWIRDCPKVLYWGDLDADGFYILENLRAGGVHAKSILMDDATLTAYADYATSTYADGRPLPHGTPKPAPHLTDEERRVLERITDPAWTGPRRIEQERIPLDVAMAVIEEAIAVAARRP